MASQILLAAAALRRSLHQTRHVDVLRTRVAGGSPAARCLHSSPSARPKTLSSAAAAFSASRPAWPIIAHTPPSHALALPSALQRRTFFGWFRRWLVNKQISTLRLGPEPDFDQEEFLEGAKAAFGEVYKVICSTEPIDKDALKAMIGPEMLKAISQTNEKLIADKKETNREMRVEISSIEAEIMQVAFEVRPQADGDGISADKRQEMIDQAKSLPSKALFKHGGRSTLPFDFARREFVRITVRFRTAERFRVLDWNGGPAEGGEGGAVGEGPRTLAEGTTSKTHSLVFRRCYMSTESEDDVEESWKVIMLS